MDDIWVIILVIILVIVVVLVNRKHMESLLPEAIMLAIGGGKLLRSSNHVSAKKSYLYVNKPHMPRDILPLSQLPRYITPDMPKMKFTPNANHNGWQSDGWGQRKLMLNEIDFLAKYYDPTRIQRVVYAGAAPGTHFDYIVKLFPKCMFELIDPRKFDIKEQDRVAIYQGFFEDHMAATYKGKNVLFMSDIRTMEIDGMSIDDRRVDAKKRETVIKQDMDRQMKWAELMEPQAAMFKMRLPYTSGKTRYYDGDICLQPWAPLESTELRLITDCKKYKEYDHTTYEEIMFFINSMLRPGINTGYDIGNARLNNRLDTCLEYLILRDYIDKHDPPSNYEKIIAMMREISKIIGQPNRMPFDARYIVTSRKPTSQ